MGIGTELLRLRRRVRVALFLQGTGQATLVLALTLAATLLTLRFLGVRIESAGWWFTGLALPPIFGLLRALRGAFGDRRGALHLDRRWNLGGLLITSLETNAGAWQPVLRARLAAAEREMPAPHVRRFFYRTVPPALVLAVVLLLPAPRVSATVHNPLLEEALAKFEEELEIAREEGRLDEQKRRELTTRVRDLRDRAAETEWSDVDGLSDRLAHEEELAKSRAERTRAALAELAQRARSGGNAGEQLLQEAGGEKLLAKLRKDIADKLAGGQLGSLTPEQLELLAQALEDAAAEGALTDPGEFADPTELEDLRRLVETEQDASGEP